MEKDEQREKELVTAFFENLNKDLTNKFMSHLSGRLPHMSRVVLERIDSDILVQQTCSERVGTTENMIPVFH